MVQFNDLPLEIIPVITRQILRPPHLAAVSLVNKSFYTYTVPLLYERASIFAWHKQSKAKATQLFRTLANCPSLARYVRKLELRDFPRYVQHDKSIELTERCVRGIHNCVNLRECTWTRDGSLKDDILEALSKCTYLHTLEINGHHGKSYDPQLLTHVTNLRKFSVIMPSAEVVQVLPAFFMNNRTSLQSLTLICKSTNLITDDILKLFAPTLTNLKQLHIAGCPKVTHKGVEELLSINEAGITELALEGVSNSFDMEEFRDYSLRKNALQYLESITLTFPLRGMTQNWLLHVELLLYYSPLRRFHLYVSGSQTSAPLPLSPHFVQNIVNRHGDTLKRFAALRLPLSIYSLDYIMRNSEIEQLFCSVRKVDLGMLGPTISMAKKLRTLHITYVKQTSSNIADDEEEAEATFEQSDEIDVNRPLPSMDELERIASHFGPSVRQFGVQTRVWQVERHPITDKNGALTTSIRLGPYESPDVPAAFLVVRT